MPLVCLPSIYLFRDTLDFLDFTCLFPLCLVSICYILDHVYQTFGTDQGVPYRPINVLERIPYLIRDGTNCMPLVNLRGSSDRLAAYPPLCSLLSSLARFSIYSDGSVLLSQPAAPSLLRVIILQGIDTGPLFRVTFSRISAFRTSV